MGEGGQGDEGIALRFKIDTLRFNFNALRFDTDPLRFKIDTARSDFNALWFGVDASRADTDTARADFDVPGFNVDTPGSSFNAPGSVVRSHCCPVHHVPVQFYDRKTAEVISPFPGMFAGRYFVSFWALFEGNLVERSS